jgi:hypothetical protein
MFGSQEPWGTRSGSPRRKKSAPGRVRTSATGSGGPFDLSTTSCPSVFVLLSEVVILGARDSAG